MSKLEKDYPYILTEKSLSIYAEGKNHIVHADNRFFKEMLEALKVKDYDKLLHLIKISERILNPSNLQTTKNLSDIQIKDGVVYYKGLALENILCDKLVQMTKEGFDTNPLVAFLENLLLNPSRTAVKELYLFLEHSKLPITSDGHFLAYKKVRSDFKDYHTGTFDHRPGNKISMPRNEVDDNRENVCSTGLHFCSLDYLQEYYSREGRVVLLKINPRDVVSIPKDHDNAKGRACSYEVIAEHQHAENESAFEHSVEDLESLVESEEGEDFTSDEYASNIQELSEEEVGELQENNVMQESTVPDHPDLEENGIPKPAKDMVGEIRVREGNNYLITAVAGPIRNTKGQYTGKWAFYVKDLSSNLESVFDITSILKDELVSKAEQNGKNNFPALSLTSDILRLAHEWQKNKQQQDFEED